MPTRTHDVVRESAKAALDAAQTAVHASIGRFVDPQSATATLAAARGRRTRTAIYRAVEERVQQSIARAKPAIAAPALLGTGHELRRWIVSLSACSYYVRILARAADRATLRLNTTAAALLLHLDEIIADNIHAASERVDGRRDGATMNTLWLFDALRQEAEAQGAAETALLPAAHLLERLDRTIARLAREEETITEIV